MVLTFLLFFKPFCKRNKKKRKKQQRIKEIIFCYGILNWYHGRAFLCTGKQQPPPLHRLTLNFMESSSVTHLNIFSPYDLICWLNSHKETGDYVNLLDNAGKRKIVNIQKLRERITLDKNIYCFTDQLPKKLSNHLLFVLKLSTI